MLCQRKCKMKKYIFRQSHSQTFEEHYRFCSWIININKKNNNTVLIVQFERVCGTGLYGFFHEGVR